MPRRVVEAEVQSLTPHDFRRTFATNRIEADIDVVTVRDWMGPSDINNTAGYDRHSADAKRRRTGPPNADHQRKPKSRCSS
ncbi:MAG: site-specific integrase [Chloroflexi bacterium]|nr:site-specific integrase [Chloroflexota bacterium]